MSLWSDVSSRDPISASSGFGTDPTSLEAFGRTADRIKTLRVLLIVTFRPEFNAPCIQRSRSARRPTSTPPQNRPPDAENPLMSPDGCDVVSCPRRVSA
jgi:hypothetical protein